MSDRARGENHDEHVQAGDDRMARAEAEDVLNRDFVSTQEITGNEDVWLRRILREHSDRTGSPRAARLLSRQGPLPLLRVQPVHLQGTVESTWEPVLTRLKPDFITLPSVDVAPAAAHAMSI